MPVLAVLLPFPTLASTIDPLRFAKEAGRMLSLEEIRAKTKEQCALLIEKLPLPTKQEYIADEQWYWLTPLFLEAQGHFFEWCSEPTVLSLLRKSADNESISQESAYQNHIFEVVKILEKIRQGEPLELGSRPADLLDVLCELALAAPGVCALRSLLRLSPKCSSDILTSAANIAMGFRSLYNLPESIALLQQYIQPSLQKDNRVPAYWRMILRYGLAGNLQAMLDEYLHILREYLGFHTFSQDQIPTCAHHIRTVLSMRTPNLKVDPIAPLGSDTPFDLPVSLRCRFALGFGDVRDEEDKRLERADTVRDAFNSPFRPEDPWQTLFSLASRDKNSLENDLVPYWLFQGKAKIERRIPMLPYSREYEQFRILKRDLALYRLVFGQPRQDDLLAILTQQSHGSITFADLEDLCISLEPPSYHI